MAEHIIPPAFREAHYAGMKHFLASGEGPVLNQRFDITAMRSCGEEFPIELAITPDRISGIQIFTAYLRDLSDRKEAERAVRQSEAQLRESQKMEAVGQLAGGIAHDFNNLLTVILGSSEAIQRKAHDEAYVRKWIREVQIASERAAAMTRQLLALSRQQVLDIRPVDLNDLLGAAEAMLSRLIPETIRVETRFSTGPLVVESDPAQLNQVILNLVINARDAIAAEGRLIFSTREVELGLDDAERLGLDLGSYAVIEVIDTGEGMSPEVAERAFEPFFTTKEAGKGTGLGLATVYGIIKQSRGEVEIESDPGAGTVVRLYLPQIEKGSSTTASGPQILGVARGNECILVVEDEKLVRDLVGEILQAEGYHVVMAKDGREALDIVETRADVPFALLVTDMVMPNMGGEELSQRLKARQPDLSVILMTGYSETGRPDVFPNGDRIHHLDKPFLPQVLVSQVRQALDEKAAR